MADILIKGLVLPKEGHIEAHIWCNGTVTYRKKIDNQWDKNSTTAIELPSVGRWIDGQELKAFLKRKMCDVRCAEEKMNCDVCVVSTLFEVIDKSPTLVCEED